MALSPRLAIRSFPWRVFSRILWMQSLLVLLALLAAGLGTRAFLKRQLEVQLEGRLRDALALVARAMPVSDAALAQWCPSFGTAMGFRFAVLASDGRALCASDTAAQPAGSAEVFRRLEGQLDGGGFRLELAQGTAYAAGWAQGEPGRGPRVLHAWISLSELSATLTVFDASLGGSLLFALLGVALFAVWSARRLVFPLGRLLLKTKAVLEQRPEHGIATHSEHDLEEDAFDEWLELESNIDDIRRDLALKAQKLSREQIELETIMGAISDAILAVDPDGNPLFYNTRFEVLFGGDGIRDKNLRLWGLFRDPEIIAAFQAALKEGRVGSTRGIALEPSGGLRRYFSLAVAPLRREGAVYGAVGVFHDVSELKSAEQMRIDFVANVSHELRTPLTVIKGYADTLVEDFRKTGGPVDYALTIARNSDRLMNLMNDLLDLSAIESTDILQRDPLPTREATERVLDQVRSAFEKKKQKVIAEYAASHVYADGNRLDQVLVNLLGNANKYTPEGGTVFVTWLADGNDTLLRVKDTGPGIPPEHHQRLFERFYRVDKARSREQGGTGLGLAIVKHILQRHGGAVWVESSSGQGATFYCRFPGKTSAS